MLLCRKQGYPGKFYCPRMATMNKPAYAAIQTHSPIKPVRGGLPAALLALCRAGCQACSALEQHPVEPSLTT